MRASFQPTALPLRALSQSPGIPAHSDRNVALGALFRLESAHHALVGTSGASLAPSPLFGKAPRAHHHQCTALRIMLARAGELPRPTPLHLTIRILQPVRSTGLAPDVPADPPLAGDSTCVLG